MSARGARLPFQPRSGNTVSTESSGSSDDYLSKGTRSSAESTTHHRQQQHNRGVSSSSSSRNVFDLAAATGPLPSSMVEPAPSQRHHNRSSSASRTRRPGLERATSAPSLGVRDPSPFHSSKGDEEIIEEKRRKVKGEEGYTIHKYRRGKMLGKGGFAKVYMCTALDTGKDYAVKIVPKANLVKARARQKLQAEIKIHRTLRHKNVCEYKHFFEDKTNCYILLELCHNQSMNEMIKRRKRLTEPEAAYFMQEMVEAVEYMHENSVIHRDLKLGNLFLDKNMHIKVGDLGLATRLESDSEKRKTICGTPNYIAPEVIQGSRETRGHSYEVDIWSMGVVLYTMLVGKPPYEAKDVKSTYQRIIANEYDFPIHIPISEPARSLIGCMLQSKPQDRPSLDDIRQHPFFTDGVEIPLFLPSSATRAPPKWVHDEFGQLVPCPDETENEPRIPTSSKEAKKEPTVAAARPTLAGARSASLRRLPFKTKDPNVDYGNEYAQPSKKEWFNPQGYVQGAAVASSVHRADTAVPFQLKRKGKPEIMPAFRVFDETAAAAADAGSRRSSATDDVKRPAKQSSSRNMQSRLEGLMDMAENMRLDDSAPSYDEGQRQLPPVTSAETDTQILLMMLERLSTVLEAAQRYDYSLAKTQATSHGAPDKWVTRYVDYTSKYGLGFLMNDGSSGVYFNDATKAVLEPDGDAFQYVERRKVQEESESMPISEPLCKMHSLEFYPDCLQKKVTLLKHFRNYLIEQQKKSEQEAGVPDSNYQPDTSEIATFVYLKKWVRTKHAILFRLSDQTVQIVFYDQTEVLLTPDVRFVTYVNKKGERCTYYLDEELVATNAELAKRLKYSKEILQQLISGQKQR